MARPLRPAEILAEPAGVPAADGFDVPGLLQRLAGRCTELLDVSAAAILLVDEEGALQAVAASDDRARRLELLGLERAEGPGADSRRTGRAAVNIDLTDEAAARSWTGFAALARAEGFVAAHAVPLLVRRRTVGALSLYGSTPVHFSPAEAALAQAMADIAGIAAVATLQQRALDRSHTENVQLQEVMSTRIVIEQAKGVLAERWNTGVDRAFAALRAFARAHELRIADLSHAVVDGRLDTTLIPPPPPLPAADGRTGARSPCLRRPSRPDPGRDGGRPFPP